MRRSQVAAATLSLAPWVVAGALLLGTATPISAQDATPADGRDQTETAKHLRSPGRSGRR